MKLSREEWLNGLKKLQAMNNNMENWGRFSQRPKAIRNYTKLLFRQSPFSTELTCLFAETIYAKT